LATAQELETKARQFGMPDFIAAALMRHGEILVTMARYAEAIEVLQKARAALKGLRKHDLVVRILAKQAEAHGKRNDWLAASSVCEEGIKLVERYRYGVSTDYIQSGYLRSRIGLYKWGVRSAYELGNRELMLERAELSKSRSMLRHQLRNTRVSENAAQLEKRFRLISAQIDKEQGTANKKRVAELKAERQTLWDLLSIQRYREVKGTKLPVFSVAAVQAVLDADEAVVYYYWLDKQNLLVITIDQRRVEPELRTITLERRKSLEVDAKTILELTLKSNKTRADKLLQPWSMLLPEVTWLKEKRRLILSPHQVLHALPFHALTWEGAPLIQRYAVTYVPNLSSLLMPYTPATQRRVLAVGIHEYQVPGYPVDPLPSAESDTTKVAKLYETCNVPVVLLTGKKAREARLQQLAQTGELAKFSCLHLTTHGENIPSDTPMESRLYLQDSVVDGLEIANWRLAADLVVLSACSAGQRPIEGRGMDELPGDDLFGLQAAFFAAGGRRLVSALWSVDAHASGPIVKEFHRYILKGDPPEVALQAAVNNFRTTAKVVLRKSLFWAPFFLAAMGRPVRKNLYTRSA
jgi:CHAT domain-containing protein